MRKPKMTELIAEILIVNGVDPNSRVGSRIAKDFKDRAATAFEVIEAWIEKVLDEIAEDPDDED